MSSHVKLFIEYFIGDSKETETESIWALPVKKGYKLDNIPFYVKGVSIGDVVSAEEVDGYLYMKELLETSGHSTIRLWFSSEQDVQSTRDTLKSMGCSSEVSDQPRLVSVDIPPAVSYQEIRAYLDEGEAQGKWDYEEACLGFL
ncbi:DUF4265 domain-containing protein [Zooshikella marina]|uniref:DUF4265 domain-containing protein n=1 Tax=Zooshikella ganghwensis TaxID=202772 RepID=UPI001BAEED3F|nr:DUF4265 domain-containing protein [Zooshikella ganghwensis]MBU2709279.1 DUF4265 domain-containing protein [Zooshikella ganghwensis]